MKRFLSISGILCLFFAVAASASESWILDIPVRGIANQETGKVRLVMGLNAAPAGSQLVVNGTTTINLGNSAAVGGDSVQFLAGNGNEIQIIYVPQSNFGANFCAGGGAVEKMIPMRFVGAQDIVDYRITSYIVGAPMAECSQVSKHTGDTPANVQLVGDGVAPVLSATFKGRNTFDVVIVLDKSGSMADNPPGANGPPSKAAVLKSAVQGFVSQWELLDAPPGGGPEWSHDRIGLVFFDTTAASQTLPGADPPANFFLQRGNANAWDSVINQANTLTPGATTSIGAGINEGMSQWKADPKSDLSMVVLTDGMQNTAPLITPTGSGFLGLTPVAGLPQELRERFIPIQTIAFGTPAQVDQTLLTNIALETSGVSYVALNASSMFNVFGMTLVALLKGNTVSIATHQLDTITGPGPTVPLPVLVDSSAERVVFSLQWAPPLQNILDLEVFKPGSNVVAAPTASKHQPQIALQAFDHPAPGVWNVRVKRTPDQHLVPVPYTLSAFFLEKHLDYQFSLDNLHAVTGDPLGIRVLVAWDGKPLTGLPDGSIRVRVQRQLTGLGTVLHDTARRVPAGTTVTPTGDIQTPLDYKLASFNGQSLLSQIALQDVVTLPLKEVGNGVYAATFDQSTVPGTYGFEAVLEWDTRLTGRIHREERLEETLGVKADPVKTTVTTTQLQPGLWTVTVTPVDHFGNFFGPGYASKIRARLRTEGGSISEVPVDARQTGDYVFTVRSPFPPEVIVDVDGVVIGGPRGT